MPLGDLMAAGAPAIMALFQLTERRKVGVAERGLPEAPPDTCKEG